MDEERIILYSHLFEYYFNKLFKGFRLELNFSNLNGCAYINIGLQPYVFGWWFPKQENFTAAIIICFVRIQIGYQKFWKAEDLKSTTVETNKTIYHTVEPESEADKFITEIYNKKNPPQ